MYNEQIEVLLDRVQKPARYMGGEIGAVQKAFGDAQVRFAFCFPDVYEVGMSHLGMKILYHMINAQEDALCERVFAPWNDMASGMRELGVPLFTLESRTPVRAFDIVGFTLQYEMSYTNILEMLDLARIPLRTSDRAAGDPIVIAGGPCAFNPEPLSAFIDAFVIGDGEESTLEVVDAVKAWKASRAPREDCLMRLAGIRGVYVPAFYDVTYHEDGTIASFARNREDVPETIEKCIVSDLDKAFAPEEIIVPFQEIVHDRIMLEVMRGCTRGCRFCQAGMLYRPVRERSMEKLVDLAEKLVESTGYEEISLSSLSTGDYSCLAPLAKALMDKLAAARVNLSLPSLRADSEVAQALAETQRVKKSSLTFAPEAGTQRLRDVINKGITEQDIIGSVSGAFQKGWSSVKLYFMIGLPTETAEDLDGIGALARAIVSEYFRVPKGVRAPGLRVALSAAAFVPKPFTPFQWVAQDTIEVFEEKQRHLRHVLGSKKGITFNWHDAKLSRMEACFARGDRRMADVLEAAWRLGCQFDGWTEFFSYDRWLEAFAACGIDPAFYANRERAREEILPWQFIDAGVTQAFLWREWQRAEQAETTPDCRKDCQGCGLGRMEGGCAR